MPERSAARNVEVTYYVPPREGPPPPPQQPPIPKVPEWVWAVLAISAAVGMSLYAQAAD